MGQILHGSATTTEVVSRAIQNSQVSLRMLAGRYSINPKTVAKWKKRLSISDMPTGPKNPKSTVLTVEEEAIIIALRKHTLLPLGDCLWALQATIENLTRSSLHRCLQRHGIARLPEMEGTSCSRGSSSHTPSVISISTLPKCKRLKENSISLLPLIEPASLSTSRFMRRQVKCWPRSSYAISLPPFPMLFISC